VLEKITLLKKNVCGKVLLKKKNNCRGVLIKKDVGRGKFLIPSPRKIMVSP